MKLLILAIVSFSGFLVNATEIIKVEQSLSDVDSSIFSEKLIDALGKEVIQNQDNPLQVLHKSNFTSKDEAISINCENIWQGVLINSNCEISLNSELSDSEVTEFKIGAVGNAKIVRFYSPKDVENLIKITTPTGRFTSSQKVLVEVNGEEKYLPKFQIYCEEVPHHTIDACIVALFPEEFVIVE